MECIVCFIKGGESMSGFWNWLTGNKFGGGSSGGAGSSLTF